MPHMNARSLSLLLTLLLIAPAALAHCDWVGGPVVADARIALERADVAPVLKWIAAADEPEIRAAFDRTLAARAAGDAARSVADQWFFETLVRVHRASEGEPFTGLKEAGYRPEPGIAMADRALEAGSLEEVHHAFEHAVASELKTRFAAVVEAKKHAGESAEAGRLFARLYADFVHYVDGVHRSIAARPAAHEH
jgi:hypothetical protein